MSSFAGCKGLNGIYSLRPQTGAVGSLQADIGLLDVRFRGQTLRVKMGGHGSNEKRRAIGRPCVKKSNALPRGSFLVWGAWQLSIQKMSGFLDKSGWVVQ
jgi:hypothetical protein